MPYYVFRINESAGALVKNLELIETFEKVRDAKLFAQEQRASAEVGDMSMIKVMFADNQLSAEEQLMEKREKPVVMEWEK